MQRFCEVTTYILPGVCCVHTSACACLQTLGGEVQTVETDGEYGRMSIRTTQASELYSDETDHAQMVWMSHGDKATRLPDGFQAVATSEKVSTLQCFSLYFEDTPLDSL